MMEIVFYQLALQLVLYAILLISYKSLQKKQAFEMKPHKNGIRLTVNGLGVPPPLQKEEVT
jgi:hypothetical protein